MQPPVSRIMFAALVIASSGAVLRGQTYTIVDLSEPRTRTMALDINNSGSIVGIKSATGLARDDQPVLWEDNRVTTIGTPAVKHGNAEAINEAGQVAVQVFDSSHWRPYLWHNRVMVSLATLPGDGFGAPNDVNDLGQVVGYSFSTLNINHAFIWDNQDGVRPLGSLGGEYSYAQAINNYGEVVGDADTGTERHAFLWTAEEGMRDLGTFGGSYSTAHGINDEGKVVGTAEDVQGERRAFVWDEENGLRDLSAPYMEFSVATDVNESGDIVGTFRYRSGHGSRRYACLWWNGAVVVLEELLDSASGWRLEQARAINDVGQIVGFGSESNNWDAFLLNPVVATVGKLDIRPGSCPNPLNPRSRGRIPVAVVGTESLDVAEIDADSLVLRRSDGTGGDVAPIAKHSGRIGTIGDVASPFDGDLCGCHEVGGDGVDDMLVHFSTIETVRILELGLANRDSQIELTMSGSLLNGTRFEASDCVRVVGRPHRATLLDRGQSK